MRHLIVILLTLASSAAFAGQKCKVIGHWAGQTTATCEGGVPWKDVYKELDRISRKHNQNGVAMIDVFDVEEHTPKNKAEMNAAYDSKKKMRHRIANAIFNRNNGIRDFMCGPNNDELQDCKDQLR